MTPNRTETQIFIHPSAICEAQQIGQGTRIWAFAHVMDGAMIGEHCNIGDHTFIENGARIGHRVTVKNQTMVWNGVTLEDEVFVGPGVIFTNDRYPRSPRGPAAAHRYISPERWLVPTRVKRGASIGAGVVILCGVTIGEYASIGAGALITKDVPDFALAMGHPAEVVGRVCKCGVPLDDTGKCGECNQSRFHWNVAAVRTE